MIEKVNPSHPDKLADRIAGALVDLAYRKARNPKIAVEVLLGHGRCHIIIETSEEFTHSEVQVLGDPFPVVNPSYTSSFVLTCPEVSTFAGAQRTSGSDQPSDPLNSPSLLAL